MADNSRVTLHWISFFLHCFAFLLLLLAYCLPFWFEHDEGANEWENGGLWVRCRVGGACVPLKDASEDLAIHMTPTQVLMTISFVSGVVALVFYGLWLWKGEMCDTPWRKRCTWCEETYTRSRKPKTRGNRKYRKMKWAAFGCSFMSGVFSLTGVVIFMVNTLIKTEGKTSQLGWCAWIALASAILLLVKNGVISLCSYLLKHPDDSDETEGDNEEDLYAGYASQDEKELARIRAWIMEQENGIDNPSFTRDWEFPKNNSIYSTRSAKSSSRGSSIYYIGQNDPAVLNRSRGSLGSGSLTGAAARSNYVAQPYRKPVKPGTGGELYSPMYSVIFKGKIPMIPKKPMTQESRFIYDTIYGWSRGTLPPVLAEYFGDHDPVSAIQNKIRRPSSHLGVTSKYDDITRTGDGIYDHRGRPMSDSNLFLGNRHNQRRGPHHDRVHRYSRSRPGHSSSDSDSDSLPPPPSGPFEPGILPDPYRRRKHPDRRSTSSLATSMTSQDHNSSFGYRVRTKYPEDSDESMELPLSFVLSHGMQGLDLAGSDPYLLDNIWVVPKKEDIPDVLGKSRVHFKLEQSIQELDEFENLDSGGSEEDV